MPILVNAARTDPIDTLNDGASVNDGLSFLAVDWSDNNFYRGLLVFSHFILTLRYVLLTLNHHILHQLSVPAMSNILQLVWCQLSLIMPSDLHYLKNILNLILETFRILISLWSYELRQIHPNNVTSSCCCWSTICILSEHEPDYSGWSYSKPTFVWNFWNQHWRLPDMGLEELHSHFRQLHSYR